MVKLTAPADRTRLLIAFARPYRRIVLALAGAGAVVAGPSATLASGAGSYLYERTLMGAADARCHLFTPEIGRALAAGRAQAHSAALRAGDTPAVVAATEQRALDKAGSVACGSHDLQLAAERLRTAYADYAKLQVLTFPGVQAGWRAERPYPEYHGGPRWSLLQTPVGQGGWVLFGLTGGTTTAVDAHRGAAPAASVRLVLRDPARLGQPYIDPRRRDLAGQVPPRDVTQVFIARTRSPAPKTLLPAGVDRAVAYQFPPEALAAMSRLDPREVAVLEFVYPSAKGDRISTAWIEIGDLVAAQAFLVSGHTAKLAH